MVSIVGTREKPIITDNLPLQDHSFAAILKTAHVLERPKQLFFRGHDFSPTAESTARCFSHTDYFNNCRKHAST